MKRIIYISLFTLLGIILQFLVHGLAEVWYIKLLRHDFDTYSLGLSWEQWFALHGFLAVILFILGAGFGFWQGRYWWQKIYVEKPAWFKKRKWK